MLRPATSGRVPGVPDVTTGGWPQAPSRLLTAYLTAYGLRNRLPNCTGAGPALNSASAFATDSNSVAANQ
jgi:hypothetical protein